MDYIWVIELADGTYEPEVTEEEPNGRGILPLLPLVAKLHLVPQRAGFAPLAIAIPEGARAAFGRWHSTTVNQSTDEILSNRTLTCAGWVRPDGSGCLLTVYPDGSISLTDELLPPDIR